MDMLNTDRIKTWTWFGLIFTLIAGTLLHFAYQWGGDFWSVFSAVNESTWEHLKLIFWPMIIFAGFEFAFYGRSVPGFIPAKVLSVLLAMLTTVALFYTYSGILGFDILPLDILTFIIGVFGGYIVFVWLVKKQNRLLTNPLANYLALGILVLFILLFAAYTFKAPHIGIFRDPVSGGYGRLNS